MARFEDLSGLKFGRLTVICRAPDKVFPSGAKARMWKCICDCGAEVITYGRTLKSGETVSCGCYHDEVRHTATRTHGFAGKYTRERLYTIWSSMRQRCGNPKNQAYKDYGGRGISVDPTWNDYQTFRIWAYSAGYSDNLSIDRIDNNRGYCPENCRWVDQSVQSNNHVRMSLLLSTARP